MKNIIALQTIVRKEVVRVFRIWMQTLVPPIITQSLYFVIFGGFVGSQVRAINGVSYMAFIVPGLVMMAVITSSFSNTVSSFFSVKFMRSIDELLVSPMSNWVIVLGYSLGGVVRGLFVGLIVFLVSMFFTHPIITHPFLIATFVLLTSTVFSLGGFLNALFAKKFDDVSIFPTFVLTPLTYLGGVFYPISALPHLWQIVSKANPIVYMIDGFRYGFYGFSSISVWISLGMLAGFTVGIFTLCVWLMNRGTGIRS